jgi:hypothetical protein
LFFEDNRLVGVMRRELSLRQRRRRPKLINRDSALRGRFGTLDDSVRHVDKIAAWTTRLKLGEIVLAMPVVEAPLPYFLGIAMPPIDNFVVRASKDTEKIDTAIYLPERRVDSTVRLLGREFWQIVRCRWSLSCRRDGHLFH